MLSAQNPGQPAGQLGTEILKLEQKLNQSELSPAERHDALTRLARLRQLSGDIAAAAANWLDAAASDPADDNARLSGALCLAAMGEWEIAALTIQPLLLAGRRGPQILHARYLDACLRTWITGDASALVSLAGNNEFAALQPVIYYTLWRSIARNPGSATAGSAELWRSRLIAEFPRSFEARAAIAESSGESGTETSESGRASTIISTVQSPVWVLLPGTAGSANPAPAAQTANSKTAPAPAPPPAVSGASPPAASGTSLPAPSGAPSSAPPPAASGTPQSAAQTPASQPAAPTTAGTNTGPQLQTGVFSREANAITQLESLKKAGFNASITRKTVNGAIHWAVTVPAGKDSGKTAQDLKKAGFDSFPVK